ncbi:MAG: histidine kinase, partial [Bacteroidota bacterium]
SFNTLIGLIEENPAKGITFTEKLTDFYRTILEVGKNDLIPLAEEVRLLKTYIHLIKERFGEQVRIDLDIPNTTNYTLPPLTLQLLIENAVKHNVASTKNPLYISAIQTGDAIVISNEKKPKYGESKSTGIGLENIKKRHTLNNLKPPLIEQSDNHFLVTIYLNKIT